MTQTIQIDRYSKVVLTVIAIASSTIAFQNIFPTANAQSSPGDKTYKVTICDLNGSNCLSPHKYGRDAAMPVIEQKPY